MGISKKMINKEGIKSHIERVARGAPHVSLCKISIRFMLLIGRSLKRQFVALVGDPVTLGNRSYRNFKKELLFGDV